MIDYHYELDFKLLNEANYSDWLNAVVKSEERFISHLNYIFCDDNYLLNMNIKYLKHNTLTDILTFDYTTDSDIIADIFISIERVRENAIDLEIGFDEELLRVMVHGVLHIVGYKDKSSSEKKLMRNKEDEKSKMFHVEQ